MKNLLMIGAALSVAACAKSPDAIAPVAMSSNEFAHLSCASLRAAYNQNMAELNASVSRQKSAVTADALGVFLIGVPVSQISGLDAEADVALNKGEDLAMRRELQQRCGAY